MRMNILWVCCVKEQWIEATENITVHVLIGLLLVRVYIQNIVVLYQFRKKRDVLLNLRTPSLLWESFLYDLQVTCCFPVGWLDVFWFYLQSLMYSSVLRSVFYLWDVGGFSVGGLSSAELNWGTGSLQFVPLWSVYLIFSIFFLCLIFSSALLMTQCLHFLCCS